MAEKDLREGQRKQGRANLEFLADAAFACQLVNDPSYSSGARFYQPVLDRAYKGLAEKDEDGLSRMQRTSLPAIIAQNTAGEMADALARGEGFTLGRQRAAEIAYQVYVESVNYVTVGDIGEILGEKVRSDLKNVYIVDLKDEDKKVVTGVYLTNVFNRKFSELFQQASEGAKKVFGEKFGPAKESQGKEKKEKSE